MNDDRTWDDSTRLIAETALQLAGELGWRDLTPARIAEACGLPLPELTRRTPAKADILACFMRLIDERVLAEPTAPDEPPRDRLFDVLMRRLDALAPYKAGVRAVARDLRRDPFAGLRAAAPLGRSMAAMLEAARLPADGPCGALRAHGLMAVWLLALDAWLDDDSPDLGSTMRVLDRHLARADALARRLGDDGRDTTTPAAGAAVPAQRPPCPIS